VYERHRKRAGSAQSIRTSGSGWPRMSGRNSFSWAKFSPDYPHRSEAGTGIDVSKFREITLSGD